MAMISYAQNAEDVLLNRLFSPDHRGFYIDVGAAHPWHHSVTKHFYDLGWRGINIEPVALLFAMLQEERQEDINLNVGLSDHEGTMTLYEVASSLGQSTFSKGVTPYLHQQGLDFEERSAPVTTLARVCEQYVNRPIDFLKIDAEGLEAAIFRGGDWHRWRPRVVMFESGGGNNWEPRFLEMGYLFATFDGLNRYYLREEDRDLLPKLIPPISVLDDYTPYEYLRPLEELRYELEVLRAALAEAQSQRDPAGTAACPGTGG